MHKTEIAVVGDPHLQAKLPRSRIDVDYLGTQLAEMDWVCLRHKHVIFLGDFLHRPSLPNEAELRVMEFLLRKKREGVSIYTIVGNHDVYNMSLERGYAESKLAIFEAAGAIEVVWPEKLTLVGGHRVWCVPMTRPVALPDVMEKGGDIVLGHYYYESSLDQAFSVTREMLLRRPSCQWFLGHDHEPHEPVSLSSGTVLHRPGALARDAAWPYNKDRLPVYCVVDSTGLVRYAIVEGASPSADVFREGVFAKSVCAGYGDLDAQLSSLFDRLVLGARSKGVTIEGALQELCCPPPEMRYLKSLLLKN